jgi:PAS domain S-box-containing protein
MTEDQQARQETKIENSLFAGGGEMGALMRSHDWTRTPLGAVEQWSQSLKTAVRIMLTSRQPMFVWWGKELINLYNDAYREIVGGKHPAALGQPAAAVWREIWDQVGPRAESAMFKNEGTYDEALLLIMERNGYPEETYYTFSYSPVPDDQGNTGGIICANTNDTQRIMGDRQLMLLRELAAQTADARTFEEVCALSASCLETNPYDLPFAMIYLADLDRSCFSLAGTCGIDRHHAAAVESVPFDSDAVWSFGEIIRTHQAYLVSDLEALFGQLPTGAWQRSPHQALIAPLGAKPVFEGDPFSSQLAQSGILVVGLNPLRLFDDNYRRLIDLVAAQISASLANANAYEEERKRAETLAELNHAKTTFFSNVSHEFRTPLTLMLSPLEDTLANATDELSHPLRETLEVVHRNGLRLLKLVNTLLDFSRIEVGRNQALYEPIDLSAFTAELASVFRAVIERAGLHLIVECEPIPEWVYVDRDLWEKIVLNLISNAFKFTFEGEITVRLQTSDQQVVLTIQDTGVGIPSHELPHLFKRFHRVVSTRSRTYEGSGIGLSLVQELVKLHGGTVSVTSVVEQGTTFTIAIPLGSAHLPPERIQSDRTLQSTALGVAPFVQEASRWIAEEDVDTRKYLNLDASETPAPALQPQGRILLADDNADMREYVKRLLSQSYEVEAVADGTAALCLIRASLNGKTKKPLPDLVLTDVMMPKLNGFELLQELRSDPQTQDLPVVLLSARAAEESRVEALEAGADDYVIKPFSARELIARVQSTLKLAQLRQTTAQQERRSEERYRAFVEQSSEAIWCFEIEEPLPISSPEDEQIQQFYQYGYLSECNQTMAQMYGVASPEELIGARLGDFLVQSNLKNIEYLRAFIGSDYRLVDAESYGVDQQGNSKIFLNNLVGVVEDEKLLRAWGTQRDITDRKQAEERLQLYADVVRNTQVGMVVWQLEDSNDPGSFRLLIANPMASAATGINFEPLIGMSMAETFPMLIQTSLVQQYMTVVRTGEALDLGEVPYQEDGITAGIYSLKAFPLPNQCLGLSFENITDRRRTEAQLRETQHFNQQVAETMPGILFVHDLLEQRNVYFNRQITDLLGYTTEQIQAMGINIVPTIIHPNDLGHVADHFEAFRSAPEGAVLGLEYQARHANGEWRWMYSRSVVFSRTAENLPRQILGVSIDISDRKHSEESLQNAQSQLESALEAGAIYTWRWKILENQLFVNAGFAHLFGIAPEQAINGLPVEAFVNSIHPDDRDRVVASTDRSIETGENFTSEYRVCTASGEERWVTARGRVEYDADGTAIAFPGALADITEQKQIEEILRQREAELRLVTNSVPALISFVDREQRYRFNNRGYEEWFGHPASEVYGKCLWEVLGKTGYDIIRPYVEQVLKGEQVTFETYVATVDEKTRDVSVTYVPRLDDCGTVQGFVALINDISDRKRAEFEREQLLAREQEAREQAESANRIKDEFLAVLSHELRTPLNPILGWSKLLRRGNLDATKTAHALETIERNAKLQTQLIEDLLDVSRILQGKLSLKMSPVDLTATLNAALETVQLSAEAKSIQLETHFNATEQVLGDSARLQQVVWNLLSNAIKFTSTGGSVSIRSERIESQVQIQVSDTGRGIPDTFLPYVFEYFRQADGSTTRTFGGLGLGLAIVRHLVELHGGTVRADSPGENQGATFTVTLPLIQTKHEHLDASNSPSCEFDSLTSLTGIRILLVDDEIDSLELITFILEQAGATVISMPSAIAALGAFAQAQPNVLVSDIGMPEMDGYMLIKQIRRLPQNEKIPAIALTAYAGEIDHRQALAAGFQRHLSKPVDPTQLVDTIRLLAAY